MIVGRFSEEIVSLLGIDMPDDPMIYMGEQNISHMQSKHPSEYEQYGDKIETIVNEPDYVRLDSQDGSIEYVKEFCKNGDYVKIAVRATRSGAYFVRSLYVLNPQRAKRYISSGNLIRVKSS